MAGQTESPFLSPEKLRYLAKHPEKLLEWANELEQVDKVFPPVKPEAKA